MMTNLFSMFDPSSYFLTVGWLILITPILIFFGAKYKNKSKTMNIFKLMYKALEAQMKLLMTSNKKMSNKMATNIFMILMIMNFMAMYPFNFTASAHISVSLTLAFTLWLSVTMYGWVKEFSHMMKHMTPTGTPPKLMNFMVIIEIISSLIRPLTLAVRLSANMVAGHLLMSLLSSFSMMSINNSIISIIVMMALSMLEMMVALVQAYVFMILITLYHNESMK